MSIPNYITISRIALSLGLLLVRPLSFTFYFIYFLCGCSDVLDGFVARKTNTTSKLGEKVDSIADAILLFILIYTIHPFLQINVTLLVWIIAIFVLRMLSLLVVFIRYKTFAMLHSVLNKVTGFLIFLYPFSLLFTKANTGLYFICMTACISAIEELLIHLTSKELIVNRKSLFKI